MTHSMGLRAVVSQDGAAILDIENNSITTLNPTGSFVWQGLQRGESVDEITAQLARETGEDPGAIAQDVKHFFVELEKQKLLPR